MLFNAQLFLLWHDQVLAERKIRGFTGDNEGRGSTAAAASSSAPQGRTATAGSSSSKSSSSSNSSGPGRGPSASTSSSTASPAAATAAGVPALRPGRLVRVHLYSVQVKVNTERVKTAKELAAEPGGQLKSRPVLRLLVLRTHATVKQPIWQRVPGSALDQQQWGTSASCSVEHLGVQDLQACVEQRNMLSVNVTQVREALWRKSRPTRLFLALFVTSGNSAFLWLLTLD